MELTHAPMTPFMDDRLPGMAPLDPAEWLHRDEAFAPQMAYRDHLIAAQPEIVLAGEGCRGASALLSHVAATLAAHDPGYQVAADHVVRPDGVSVGIDHDAPLTTLARMVQEDLLILHRPNGAHEHVLIGAALLFPSRWSLAEKMGQPLGLIHDSVPDYDGDLARRVQRLFDVLKVGRPLVRANWLVHPSPELHQPRYSTGVRKLHKETGRYWLRVERQSILRIEGSDVAVFSVKTLITPVTALSPDQRAGLIRALERQSTAMREYHGGREYNDTALASLRTL